MSPEEFLREFGHLAETDGGVEGLRTLILAQAYQGRLGGHDAPTQRLADVCEIEMGNSPPGTSYNDAGDGVPLITGPVEFSSGPFGATRRTKFTTAPTRMCKQGDILICVRGATTGRTNVAAFDACIGRGVAAIRPNGESRYVHWFLVYSAKRLLASGTGTTFPAISKDQVERLELPVPPLPEQKRIVEKVDQLMALCDELEAKQKEKRAKAVSFNKAALKAVVHAPDKSKLKSAWSRVQDHFEVLYELPENVKELRQTILQLAVMGKLVRQEEGDEPAHILRAETPTTDFDVPPKWAWAYLGDLGEFINGDRSKNYPSKIHQVSSGIPFINAGHLANGRVNFREMNYITEERFELLRSGKVEPADILYCLRGSLGKCAIVQDFGLGAIASSLVILRLRHSLVDPQYALVCLNSTHGQKLITEYDNGTAQPNLSASDVRLYRIPLPPLSEQKRIIQKVDQLMSICDGLEAKLAQHRDQGQRLMQAVVEGLVA